MSVLVKDEYGRLVVSLETTLRLNEIMNAQTELSQEEQTIRSTILEEMIDNNVDKCKTENLTFTQILPKPIEHFDIDSFLLNENELLVNQFSNVEDREEIDIEMLKNDYPEIYKKVAKHNYITTVDTKALAKALPLVYNNYVSFEQSDKKPTLRIVKDKEK